MTEPPHRSAWRLPDGRIVAPLRAEGPGGMVGDGMATLAPGDPLYDEWDRYLDHLATAPAVVDDDDLTEDDLAFLDAAGDDVTPRKDEP